MWFRTLFGSLKPGASRRPVRPARDSDPRRRPAPCRLSVEALDDRIVPASLSVGDATITEGNAGTRYAAAVVRLDAPSNKTVTVNYATAAGTATAGSDYQVVSGKLTFAPGETSKSILVPVTGDRLPEADENFVVKLSGAKNANIADGRAVITIVDDEPRLRISDAAVWEGNSGTTLTTFTVSLSSSHDETVTVNYSTADGTATTTDNDYAAASGTLTFAPGETTKTVTVEVIGNDWIENWGYDETFSVNLSGASGNALVIDGQGIGTIREDDVPVQPPGGDECSPDHPYYPNC